MPLNSNTIHTTHLKCVRTSWKLYVIHWCECGTNGKIFGRRFGKRYAALNIHITHHEAPIHWDFGIAFRNGGYGSGWSTHGHIVCKNVVWICQKFIMFANMRCFRNTETKYSEYVQWLNVSSCLECTTVVSWMLGEIEFCLWNSNDECSEFDQSRSHWDFIKY